MVLADEVEDIASTGIRVGVISFSYYRSIDARLQEWTDNIDTLYKNITKVRYDGSQTNTHVAIDSAISELGPDGPRVIVLFSDGDATDTDAAKYAANKAKEDGILIYGVGIGKELNLTKLNTLSSFLARNFSGSVALSFPIIKDIITDCCKYTMQSI